MKSRMIWWTPAYNTYHCELKLMLLEAIKGEKAAIRQYQRQAGCIQDTCICDILNRIILDEEKHVEILTDLYERYVEGKEPEQQQCQ